MKLTPRRLLAIGGATAVVVTAAGLGIGLKHPDASMPTVDIGTATTMVASSPMTPTTDPDPVWREVSRLMHLSGPSISIDRATCIAKTLVHYGADGDKWDALVPSERDIVEHSIGISCPAV